MSWNKLHGVASTLDGACLRAEPAPLGQPCITVLPIAYTSIERANCPTDRVAIMLRRLKPIPPRIRLLLAAKRPSHLSKSLFGQTLGRSSSRSALFDQDRTILRRSSVTIKVVPFTFRIN